jgi:transposase
MPRGKYYPIELRERAVRMVAEIDRPRAVHSVAVKLGVHDDTLLRYWIKKAPADKGERSGRSVKSGTTPRNPRKLSRPTRPRLRKANR